jgi:hypothetical protein
MTLMKGKASALTMILALLLSMGAMTLQVRYCMPLSHDVHVYDDTDVYDIYGRGANVTLTVDKPENKAYNSTVTFTLKILEPYTAGGYSVSPNEYVVANYSFPDGYFISGVVLDYDRARAIDALWVFWADSRNKTHVEEAKSFYSHSYGGISSKSGSTYFGDAVLPELSEGSHNLTVWVRAQVNQITTYIPFWAAFSKTITFTIDTVAPNVTVLSSESNMYKTSSVPLNFTVNETVSQITYCLDGQDNVTTSGNTTLTDLPNGDHNVTVYATDEFGNTGASETIYFKVDVPFPTTLVAALTVVSVFVIVVALTVYFKKRRREA